MGLGQQEIDTFIERGFVKLETVFAASIAERCVRIMWPGTGCSPGDSANWTAPLVRLPGYDSEPFRAAAREPVLEKALDQLIGPGRWVRGSGFGPIPVRFPHTGPQPDDYWHFEGSYLPEGWTGHTFTNYRSRALALFLLVLFTDVTAADAPTRLRASSHLAVPRRLLAYGEAGVDASRIAETGILEATAELPVVEATGHAGDIYLCHPFLVHAASAHRGTTPRFLATQKVAPAMALELDRIDGAYSPVEQAIRLGLEAKSVRGV
ncbi:phytanoyl-CoA dioxygenase family protein [Nocardia sp. NPDC055321]